MTCMKVKIYVHIFILIFFAFVCRAQTRKIDSLRLEIHKQTKDSAQVKSLTELSQVYLYRNADSAFYYIYKADALARQIHWKKGVAQAGYRIGWFNYFIGNYDTAMVWYKRTLPVCKEMELSKDKNSSLEGKKGLCTIYGAMGDLLSSKSDYSNALKNFLMSLKFAEEIKNLDDIARQNTNIGNIYVAQGDNNKALGFFTKALKLREKTGNKRGIAVTLESMGGAYYGLNEYDNALLFFFRALDIIEKFGDPRRAAVCYINISNTYVELKSYIKARDYSLKALEICQRFGDKSSIGESMVSLGNAYKSLKNYKTAEFYFKKALDISDSLGTLEGSTNIHRILSELYKNTHNADKVFEHYTAYVQLKDSIYSEQNKKAQMEAEVNFEFQKKEALLKMAQERKTAVFEAESKQQRQIIVISVLSFVFLLLLSLLLLRSYRQKEKTNKLLATQKLELEKAGKEKDSLLNEIHHRVKNNLQVISGLLSLQNSEHQSDELKAILKEGQSRVKSMALIHQMLYQNQNLSTIPFQDYLEELSKLIEKSFGAASKKIEINVDAQNIAFDVDTAIPLGLIVNELLSNAIKYAFENKEKGGRIDISLNKLETNRYNLTIKDDGSGIPDSFNFETSKSLGLRLVKMLCTQIRAELKMNTSNGTSIEIKFADTWKN